MGRASAKRLKVAADNVVEAMRSVKVKAASTRAAAVRKLDGIAATVRRVAQLPEPSEGERARAAGQLDASVERVQGAC